MDSETNVIHSSELSRIIMRRLLDRIYNFMWQCGAIATLQFVRLMWNYLLIYSQKRLKSIGGTCEQIDSVIRLQRHRFGFRWIWWTGNNICRRSTMITRWNRKRCHCCEFISIIFYCIHLTARAIDANIDCLENSFDKNFRCAKQFACTKPSSSPPTADGEKLIGCHRCSQWQQRCHRCYSLLFFPHFLAFICHKEK